MFLSEIRLQNFRCYESFQRQFEVSNTFIVGRNGVGKTALLEAIYFASRLKSFRTGQPRDLIRHGTDSFAIQLHLTDLIVRVVWSSAERNLTVNGEKIENASDFWGLIPCVAFVSTDLEWVRGKPADRRRFLNSLMAQLNRDHLKQILRYHAILKQRNALLSNESKPDVVLLKSLTNQLREVGLPMQKTRLELARKIQHLANIFHQKLTEGTETLILDYRPNDWEKDFNQEWEAKRSLIGFHRDSVEILIREKRAHKFASEGQQRAAALSLRAAEAVLIQKTTGQTPILLVDDIFGELDPFRRSLLKGWNPDSFQSLITLCDENSIVEFPQKNEIIHLN